jgi:hypothetical protein
MARRGVVFVVVALAGFVGAPAETARAAAAAASDESPRVTVLSGRPDMVTGGDVLVAAPSGAGFEVDGAPAEADEVRDGEWLVTGLPEGRSRLAVRAGERRTTIRLRNFPLTGPVFSGPHLPLLACSTDRFGLGPPTDANCSAPTRVTERVRVDGTFVPSTGSTDVAGADQATVDGEPVPFVVTTETGVINRSVYFISKLAGAWNGRLVYRYGGGCGQSYGQGTPLGVTTVVPDLLAQGYAVATATFNTLQVQCNDVLSAETTMMVKERFSEAFGVPELTIGDGGSGGAIQQLSIAQNYPGLLDAIAPSLPFPDALSISPGVSDCGLLGNYFRTPAGAQLTAEQRAAISGYETWNSCQLWISTFLGGVDPTDGCDPAIPRERVYDPERAPEGIRCDLADANVNQLGTDPATGFANRPLDNVGVQYGLRALEDGTIDVTQFLDLNEHIGGYDVDGTITPERETAPTAAFRRAYATGRVLQGTATVRRTPIIATNVYTDPQGDIHTRVRAFTIRERLRRAGRPPERNQVIWTRPSGGNLAAGLAGAGGDSATLTATLDEWLTEGERPANAVDTCTDAAGAVIASGPDPLQVERRCNETFPVFGDPRTAAGAPLRNDILKCRRRPVRAGDYAVELTAGELGRLRQVFPDGVCDWTRRGYGQVRVAGTWFDYSRPERPVPLGVG